MKSLPIPVLKGYPCVGAPLCSLRVPGGFDVRARSEVSSSHILPQSVLAAITLVGGGARDEGVRARARCEPGLLLCSVVIITLSGGGGPRVLQQKP